MIDNGQSRAASGKQIPFVPKSDKRKKAVKRALRKMTSLQVEVADDHDFQLNPDETGIVYTVKVLKLSDDVQTKISAIRQLKPTDLILDSGAQCSLVRSPELLFNTRPVSGKIVVSGITQMDMPVEQQGFIPGLGEANFCPDGPANIISQHYLETHYKMLWKQNLCYEVFIDNDLY